MWTAIQNICTTIVLFSAATLTVFAVWRPRSRGSYRVTRKIERPVFFGNDE